MSVLFIVLACSGATERATPTSASVSEEASMRLTSSAFDHEGDIPSRHTCDGADLSPALTLRDIPAETVSLALVMDDPDAPAGTWDHWLAYDIAPVEEIPEGVATLGTPGTNSWGRTGYGGPCPPRGTHRYFFALYALDAQLDLPAGVDKATLLEALAEHVLARAVLVGRYSRG